MADEKQTITHDPAPPTSDEITKEATYEAAEKVESNPPQSEWKDNEETARVLDHKAERSLCWKLDIRLMPVLAIMCESGVPYGIIRS